MFHKIVSIGDTFEDWDTLLYNMMRPQDLLLHLFEEDIFEVETLRKKQDYSLYLKLSGNLTNEEDKKELKKILNIGDNSAAEDQLKRGLENDVDAEYWVPILKQALNITKLPHLKNLTMNDVEKLRHYARNDWELEAFANLVHNGSKSPKKSKSMSFMAINSQNAVSTFEMLSQRSKGSCVSINNTQVNAVQGESDPLFEYLTEKGLDMEFWKPALQKIEVAG